MTLRDLVSPAIALARRAGEAGRRQRLAAIAAGDPRPCVVTAACWDFPISSQTFVYQEIHALESAGLQSRMFCCRTGSPGALPTDFQSLWPRHVVVPSMYEINRRDREYFERSRPQAVAALLARLSEATGLGRSALLAHPLVGTGFSFARLAELARARYVHSYFFYDQTFMALMAASLLQVPRGVTAYADHMLNDYDLKCVPLHLATADIVVATSERIRRELKSLAGDDRDRRSLDDRILVKPNGIDTTRFLARDPVERLRAGGAPRLISVSRIEPKKGLSYLVDAVGILRQRGLPVTADIVGGVDGGSPRSAETHRDLVNQIQARNLDSVIRCHGRQSREALLPLLADARLFVAPYVEVASGDKDGIPTALLEAMASGLPIVATDAGSISEAMTTGREGLCVRQRDAQALADAIARVLGNDVEYVRYATAARARAVQSFDIRVTEPALHRRIHACIDGTPA